jgi:phage-related protein (TIGR01555 family)
MAVAFFILWRWRILGKGNSSYANDALHLLENYTGVKAVRPLGDPSFRMDGGYQNVLNKYGTSRDLSEWYNYVSEGPVSDQELTEFYEQNGLFARVIDAPSEEAVKHGFEMKDLEDDEVQDFVNECLDELDWEETAMQCLKWARLFGGSIAVVLINDGRGLEEPVDYNHIKSIDDIRIFDRSLIQPEYTSMYHYEHQDPFRTRGSRLGYPEHYTISSRNGLFTVHEQRCLIFQNGVLPENTTTGQYQFWGMPEYVRINRAVKDVEIAHGMATKLLDRSVQAIYTMKDLAMTLATEQGEENVLKRLQTIDMAKGLLNTMVIDADGEGYDFKSFSYTGISDVINTTCNYLSALTNIPQTILFGRSPAGMNATGSSDLENYYNYIERIQKRMLRSNLRYLIALLCQAGVSTKEIKRVPKIKIEFNSIWSMSEQEKVALDAQKAQIEATKANTAVALVGAQILDPSEVRKEYAKEDEFDIDTMLDDYSEEELEENAPANQQGGDPMAAMMGGGDPMAGGEDPMAAMMGGQEPQGTPKEAPQTGGEKPKPVQEKKLKKKNDNAPDAAPEATKLSQDMDKEINEDEEDVTQEEISDAFHHNGGVYRGGVGVLVVQRNKILTATRIDGDAGGFGQICGPGGHIEEFETPEQAAIRETEEEFGIRPVSLKLLGIIGDKDPDVEKSYIFIANEFYGEVICDEVEMRVPVWRGIEEMYEMEEKLFQPFRDSLTMMLQQMYREDGDDISFTEADEVYDNL